MAIEFPLNISLRVVGRNTSSFTSLVILLIRRHVPDVEEDGVGHRYSQDDNYVSVIVPLVLESREQFDAVYRELAAHEQIIMVI